MLSADEYRMSSGVRKSSLYNHCSKESFRQESPVDVKSRGETAIGRRTSASS